MIEAGLTFQWLTLDRAISALRSLPPRTRPVYFSLAEAIDSKKDLIDDPARFSAFLARSKHGFFLSGEDVTYNFRITPRKFITCDCFLNVEEEEVRKLAKQMAEASPIFGFACSPEERQWRNRINIKLTDVQTMEAWVGRDPLKYIPGLYWVTIIPESLARRHHINLAEIEEQAHVADDCGNGIHIIQFFLHPGDWKQRSKYIDDFCAKRQGVFSIMKLASLVGEKRQLTEIGGILSNWQ